MARESAGPPALLRTPRDPAPSLGCPWNVRSGSVPHGTCQTVASRRQGAGWQAGWRGRLSPRTHEGDVGWAGGQRRAQWDPRGAGGPAGAPASFAEGFPPVFCFGASRRPREACSASRGSTFGSTEPTKHNPKARRDATGERPLTLARQALSRRREWASTGLGAGSLGLAHLLSRSAVLPVRGPGTRRRSFHLAAVFRVWLQGPVRSVEPQHVAFAHAGRGSRWPQELCPACATV